MTFDFSSIWRFLEELSVDQVDPFGIGEREPTAESRERRRRLRRKRPDWEQVTSDLDLPYTKAKNPQGLPIVRTSGTTAGFAFEVCTDHDTSGVLPKEVTRFRVHYPSLELDLELRSSLKRDGSSGRLKHQFLTQRGSTELVQAYATEERLTALRAVLTARICELTIGDSSAEYWIDGFRPTAQGLAQEIERLGELALVIHPAPSSFGEASGPTVSAADAASESEAPIAEAAHPHPPEPSAALAVSASPSRATDGEAAPQASPPVLAFAPLALDLFQAGSMSHVVRERFEREFAGQRVRGSGTLESARSFHSDLNFDGPGTLVTLHFPSLRMDAYSGDVRRLIALPSDVELNARPGESVHFEGQLRACDPFLRKVFVDQATLAPTQEDSLDVGADA